MHTAIRLGGGIHEIEGTGELLPTAHLAVFARNIPPLNAGS